MHRREGRGRNNHVKSRQSNQFELRTTILGQPVRASKVQPFRCPRLNSTCAAASPTAHASRELRGEQMTRPSGKPDTQALLRATREVLSKFAAVVQSVGNRVRSCRRQLPQGRKTTDTEGSGSTEPKFLRSQPLSSGRHGVCIQPNVMHASYTAGHGILARIELTHTRVLRWATATTYNARLSTATSSELRLHKFGPSTPAEAQTSVLPPVPVQICPG
jgi:hypothetical protein